MPAVMHRLSHKETFTKMLQRQQTFAPQVLYKVPTVPTREVEEKSREKSRVVASFAVDQTSETAGVAPPT